MGFRYRPGLGIPYDRQGLVYFTSRTYDDQPPRVRRKIDNLCRAAAGEHWRALFDYAVNGDNAVAVSRRHHIGENTLYRAVRRYYQLF